MQSLHGNAISGSDVSRLLDICIRTTPVTIETCPLCVLKPQEDDLDPEVLLDHIADHIHDFSLSSLPWADTLPETVVRAEKATFCKVRNWLDERTMDDDDNSEDEICDPTPNVLLLDYFAESAGTSSCAYRESQATGSILTLDSRSGVDSEIGSDVAEPSYESSSEPDSTVDVADKAVVPDGDAPSLSSSGKPESSDKAIGVAPLQGSADSTPQSTRPSITSALTVERTTTVPPAASQSEQCTNREVAAELPTDSLGLNVLVTPDNAVVE